MKTINTIIYIFLFIVAHASFGQPLFSELPTAIPVTGKIEWGDFDIDGDQDALVLESNVMSLYTNSITGTTATFTLSAITFPAGTATDHGWVDINNDGYLDVYAKIAGGLQLLISKKALSFSLVTPVMDRDPGDIVDWGDVDKDGDLDLLANGVFENKGNYKFESKTDVQGTMFTDYDSDGDLDVLATDKIYSNLGGFVFSLLKYFYQEDVNGGADILATNGSTTVDIDGDGNVDFLGVKRFTRIYPPSPVEPNEEFMINAKTLTGPGGTFNPWDGVTRESILSAADFDNDGSIDVISFFHGAPGIELNFPGTSYPPALNLYSKDDEGEYVVKFSLEIGDQGKARAVDFNKDGKLDLSFGGQLLVNNSPTIGTPPTPPTNLAHTITGNASASFSWSQATDNNTPAKSITYNLLVTRKYEPFFNKQVSSDFKTVVTGSGNVGNVLKFSLGGLPNGTYQWSVQSVDGGLATSAFPEPLTFEIKNSFDAVSPTALTDNFKIVFNETNNQYLAAHLEGGQVIAQFVDGRTMQPDGKTTVINSTTGAASDFNIGYNKTSNKYFVVWSVSDKIYGAAITPENTPEPGTEVLLYTAATTPHAIVFSGGSIPFNSTDGENGLFWIEQRVLELEFKFFNLSYSTSLQSSDVKDVVSKTMEQPTPDISDIDDVVIGSDVQYIPQYKSYALSWSYSGRFKPSCGVCSVGYYLRTGYFLEAISKDGAFINSQKLNEGVALDPRLQYDPFNNSFLASWNVKSVEQANSGRVIFETSTVKLRQFKLSKEGVITNLSVKEQNLANTTSQSGDPNVWLERPHISWTPKRNELILSFNTDAGIMYFQRFNQFDTTFIEQYQTTITSESGSAPKTFMNTVTGDFLLGWIQGGEGHFKKFKINKDAPPVVNSFEPTSAYPGDTVLIHGENFGRTPFINTVKFGSIEAHVDTLYFDKTKVRVVVPPGLSRVPVPITLTFDDQTATSANLFENLTLHSVTALDKTEGLRGDIVKITGDRFATDKDQIQIRFGTVNADLTDATLTTTEIQVKIPEGALRGTWDVVVVIQGQEVPAPHKLRVIVPPVITNVTASEGFISCKTVTIGGKEFSNTASDLKIKFGSVPVTASDVLATTTTTIVVKVPIGAQGLEKISIETDDRIVYSDAVNMQLGSTISPTSPAPPTAITLSNRTDDGVNVQLRILNECSVQATKLWTKGISEGDASWKNTPLTLESNRADARLGETQFTDPIGLNLMFEIDDLSGKKIYSDTFFIRKNFTELDSTNNVPGLAFGGAPSDYQIISIPYQLTPNNIPSVFKDIVNKWGSDSSKWRLFHYLNTGNNPHYVENTRGLDKIEPGKGYWMIVRYPQEIYIDGAQAVDLTNGPFEITLQPGWNQVGNPYNFTINWTNVLAFNNNPTNLEGLKVFANGAFQSGTSLAAFRGGFVKYNGTTPLVIKIPYAKTSSGGRLAVRSSVLAEDQWYAPLKLSGNILTNETLGIGMDPNAREGRDALDESRLPSFYNQLDVAFDGNLASSVVGTDNQFTWKFVVNNRTKDSKLTFTWDNTSFGDNDRNLMLYDVANERVIDMRTTNTYSFSFPGSRDFKVFYGDKAYIDEKLVPEQVLLGEAYPNPMRSETTIPFTVSENGTHVKLSVYNAKGERVATLHDKELQQGFYEINWNANDHSTGLYIYRLESTTKKGVVTQSRKLVRY